MNAASPSTEPTDRSTLRVMITSVWPAARIAKIDAFSARLRSESALTKRGSMIAVTTMSRTNARDDAELADAEDPVGEAAGLAAAGGLRGGGVDRRHAAASAIWPVAARMTALLVGLGPRELAGQPALVHDEHAVGHAEHLGQLARDHQHRDAAPGELGEQPVDLGLRADVDAARRLVDDQHLRLGREPLREHDLLLVAAREEPDRVVERWNLSCSRVAQSRRAGARRGRG